MREQNPYKGLNGDAWRHHGAFELRQLGNEFLEIASVVLANYRIRQPELHYARALVPAPILCNALKAIELGLSAYLDHSRLFNERERSQSNSTRLLGLAFASGLTTRCGLTETQVSALKSASFAPSTKEFRYGLSKLVDVDQILDATRALFRGLDALEMRPSLPLGNRGHRRKWLHPITAPRW
jgi:hypothetical protein